MALPPGGAAARGACISRRINSTGLVVEGIFFLLSQLSLLRLPPNDKRRQRI